MKNRIKLSALVILSLLFTNAFSQNLKDLDSLAKVYLSDISSMEKENFVKKYSLTDEDLKFFNETKKNQNDETDNSALNSEFEIELEKNYDLFKAWMTENSVSSLDIKYDLHGFEVSNGAKGGLFHSEGILFMDSRIFIDVKTQKYALDVYWMCISDHWLNLKLKDIFISDENYQLPVNEGIESAVMDSAAAYDENYEYYEDTYYDPATEYADSAVAVNEENYDSYYNQESTKKQQKIDKKINKYYRKIDKLYIKRDEGN
jgi:hypothetical protein